MLKGNTELVVTDAKTGEVKQRVIDDNLVTDALQNIFTGAFDSMARCMYQGTADYPSAIFDLSKLYYLPNGVAEDLFGGILLFGDTLNEVSSHCIPTPDEIKSILGYASRIEEPLAGSKMKGTFNKTESTFEGNMAKLVFDFDTDIANGTIKSIALTSAFGARYAPNSDIIPEFKPNQVLSFKDDKIFADTNKTEYYASSVRPSVFQGKEDYDALYVSGNKLLRLDTRSNTLSIYDLRGIFNHGLGLHEAFKSGRADIVPRTEFTTTKEYYKIIPCRQMNAIWGYDRTASTKESLVLNKISGTTPTETSKTIPLTQFLTEYQSYFNQEPTYSNIMDDLAEYSIIDGSSIYFILGDVNNADQTTSPTKARIFKLDFNGKVSYNDISKEAISLLFRSNTAGGDNSDYCGTDTKFSDMCGMLCVGYNRHGSRDVSTNLMVDTVNLEVVPKVMYTGEQYSLGGTGGTKFYTPSFVKEPWISCPNIGGERNKGKESFSLEIYANYLATINNLKEVVTKTSADKLRIVYTLKQI